LVKLYEILIIIYRFIPKHIILYLILYCYLPHYCYSQDFDYYENNQIFYENRIYKDGIYTALLHRDGFDLTYPFIELKSTEKLRLSFDDFSDNTSNYYYTIIHCDANWQPSPLSPMDYIDGFVDDQITDYNFSFNTLQPFVHYSLTIPNENFRIKLSGNYILLVFEDGLKDFPVLTKKFMVVDSRTEIKANIKRATIINLMRSHQEIDIVLRNTFRVRDPFQDIQLVILQNGRWDNAITNLKPIFVRDDELIYDYEEENTFPGGSEFRYFDLKSIRYQSERIQAIEFIRPLYHVYLVPDEFSTFKVYLQWQDLNGKFLIKNSDANDSRVEADYVNVHFSLERNQPVSNGNIYVFGLLSDWQFSRKNMMKFNAEAKKYELTMLLKQGYYDYQYVYLEDKSTIADAGFIEGNHWQTENDYIVLTYYREFGSRYDQLTGFKVFNSKNADKLGF